MAIATRPARPVPAAHQNGAAHPVPAAPVPEAEPIRSAGGALLNAPLSGRLEGHHVVLDEEQLTFGFLEDVLSAQPGPLREALTDAIVDGSLFDFPPEAAADPEARREAVRAGLRRLHIRDIAALISGIRLAVAQVPKGS